MKEWEVKGCVMQVKLKTAETATLKFNRFFSYSFVSKENLVIFRIQQADYLAWFLGIIFNIRLNCLSLEEHGKIIENDEKLIQLTFQLLENYVILFSTVCKLAFKLLFDPKIFSELEKLPEFMILEEFLFWLLSVCADMYCFIIVHRNANQIWRWWLYFIFRNNLLVKHPLKFYFYLNNKT